MGANGVEDLGAAGVNTANDVVGVGAKGSRQPERRDSKLLGDLVAVSLDRFDGSRAAAADATDHIVGMRPHGAPREFGCVRETSRHPVAMRIDRLNDGILRSLDAIDTLIRAPSATMRSSVEEPVRSIARVMSSDAAPSEAVSFCPVSARRSLKLPPATSRSWVMLS